MKVLLPDPLGIDYHGKGNVKVGSDEIPVEYREERPLQVILPVDEAINVVMPNGDIVGVVVGRDKDGDHFLMLTGRNCNLAGEEPGVYYTEERA